ncbi:MAG: endonuclease/exonuclease/phosphatase family protein [Mariniblastus sp.]|nr:endonuclease/exonuclease/phosphatase family protein [Mariniblastus sp.]
MSIDFGLGARILFAVALLLQTGCDQLAPLGKNKAPDTEGQYNQVDGAPSRAPQLAIGSFNIQMLGRTKMSKPGVVQVLVDVARRYDILAIQELRDKDQKVIPQLLNLINADGMKYAAAVGPRQGYPGRGSRTYYEQSVFLYDTSKVDLIGPTYVAEDRYQIMHRAPFVGHFRSVQAPQEKAFQFVLMNVHVDYDEATAEFQALREIIRGIYPNHPGEDDFILLGDMNDSPDSFPRWMNSQVVAIPAQTKTNTLQTKAYDNIIFDAMRTSEFQQQSGVFNLMETYGLSQSDAQLVSDHLPIWAIFSAYESPSAAITQSNGEVIR